MKSRNVFPKRPLRLDLIYQTDEPLYFITFCTFWRRKFLAPDAVHQAFIEFSKDGTKRNIAVGRYVIMPDHVHLFVRGGPGFYLGRWIASLKQALAKSASLRRTRSQIWQEGFFDHVIRSDESYAEKWEYIRRNPVRANLVRKADEWRYQGEIVLIDRA